MEDFSFGKRTPIREIDYNSKDRFSSLNEKGFILLETTISLSIILIILSIMGSVIFWSIQKSKEFQADFELSRELLYVMERVTEDANFSDRVALSHYSYGDKIVIKYRNKAQTKEKDFKEIYYAQENAPSYGLSRIIVNSANAPMTGDSELGKIHILSFKVKKISSHILSIELEGMSRVTKHTYKLKSAAYVQGEIIDNI